MATNAPDLSMLFTEDSDTSGESSGQGFLCSYEESDNIYSDPKRSTTLLNAACLCFKEGLYTDVTVVVEETRFDTHRLVLASLSDYFPPLFKMDQTGKGEVTVNQVSAEDFAVLLRFAYTGKIQLSQENVQGILMAADYLSINIVSRACEMFMSKHLDSENVCDVFRFATAYSLTHLREESKTFLCNNFENAIASPGFLEMDSDILHSILDDDNLILYNGGLLRSIQREELIFKSVLQYLSQSPQPKKEIFDKLIRAVRLPLLTKDILKKCLKKYKTLEKNELLKQYITLSKQFQDRSKNTEEFTDIPESWLRLRKLAAFGFHNGIRRYASGGEVGHCPNPPKCFQKDPDLEIAQIDVSSVVWAGHTVLGGIRIKYRKAGTDKIVKEHAYGSLSHNKQSSILEVGEYIISVKMCHGHLIDGMVFETSLGRTLDRLGGGGGAKTVEKAPPGTVAYLHDINCSPVNAHGVGAIHNLQLHWITFD